MNQTFKHETSINIQAVYKPIIQAAIPNSPLESFNQNKTSTEKLTKKGIDNNNKNPIVIQRIVRYDPLDILHAILVFMTTCTEPPLLTTVSSVVSP